MTHLLEPGTRQTPSSGASAERGRPVALGAVVAGVVGACAMLLCCMAVAIAGWFASDAGGHGDTRDALRVGADAWLLAHGSTLELRAATVAVVPLGLTVLCGYVTYRLGRWAALTGDTEDDRALALAAAALAGVYGAIATVTAVFASLPGAEPSLGRAFVGGFVVAGLAGGSGLVAGSGRWPSWRERIPGSVLAVVTSAASVVLLILAASALLVGVALALDFGSGANVLSRLHTGAAGGLLYTLVVAGFAPNAVLLGSSYLLGPGFAVGTGTLVSPAAVVLGPLPAFPLVAALPGVGTPPTWTVVLLGAPVLAAVGGVALTARRFPAVGYGTGALRGLLGGVLAGLVLTLLVGLAGGSVGPGRMAQVGAPVADTLLAAMLATGAGGLVSGLVSTWWLRRRTASD